MSIDEKTQKMVAVPIFLAQGVGREIREEK